MNVTLQKNSNGSRLGNESKIMFFIFVAVKVVVSKCLYKKDWLIYWCYNFAYERLPNYFTNVLIHFSLVHSYSGEFDEILFMVNSLKKILDLSEQNSSAAKANTGILVWFLEANAHQLGLPACELLSFISHCPYLSYCPDLNQIYLSKAATMLAISRNSFLFLCF